VGAVVAVDAGAIRLGLKVKPRPAPAPNTVGGPMADVLGEFGVADEFGEARDGKNLTGETGHHSPSCLAS
jgi:hypothetical protein